MSDEARDGPASARPAPDGGLKGVRHWGGFLTAGLMAFAVDLAGLEIGVRLLHLDPLVARIGAISLAMVVGWLAHRRLTFRLTTQPTFVELVRYIAAAWTAALVNYAVFAAVLLLWAATPRLAALVAASAVSMIFSYIAMRYSVFSGAREGR